MVSNPNLGLPTIGTEAYATAQIDACATRAIKALREAREVLAKAQRQADALRRQADRDRKTEADLAERLAAWRELPAECGVWTAFGEGRCTLRGTPDEVAAHRARHAQAEARR